MKKILLSSLMVGGLFSANIFATQTVQENDHVQNIAEAKAFADEINNFCNSLDLTIFIDNSRLFIRAFPEGSCLLHISVIENRYLSNIKKYQEIKKIPHYMAAFEDFEFEAGELLDRNRDIAKKYFVMFVSDVAQFDSYNKSLGGYSLFIALKNYQLLERYYDLFVGDSTDLYITCFSFKMFVDVFNKENISDAQRIADCLGVMETTIRAFAVTEFGSQKEEEDSLSSSVYLVGVLEDLIDCAEQGMQDIYNLREFPQLSQLFDLVPQVKKLIGWIKETAEYKKETLSLQHGQSV